MWLEEAERTGRGGMSDEWGGTGHCGTRRTERGVGRDGKSDAGEVGWDGMGRGVAWQDRV